MGGPKPIQQAAAVPSYTDPATATKLEKAEQDRLKSMQNMKGRQSTILTGGLGDTKEFQGNKATLLG